MGRDLLGRLLDGGCDRVLTDGYDLAKSLNVAHARDGRGAFGVVAQTARSWIEGLWELWGDGRLIVGPLQRQMVLREVLAEGGFEDAPHLPAMLGGYLGPVFGLPEFRAVLDGGRPRGLSQAEHRVLARIETYRLRLEELGYIEGGEAQLRLAKPIASGIVPVRATGTRIAYCSDAPMPPDLRAFFEASGLASSLLATPDIPREGGPGRPTGSEVQAAPDGLDVSFAFPSGAYARPQLLLALVEERLFDGPVTICARDPVALYESIAPGLAARGIRCAVRGSKPFARTSLGSAYLALYEFLSADPRNVSESQLADVMAFPLLGIGRSARWLDDVELRGDRLIERNRMVSEYLCASRHYDPRTGTWTASERRLASLFHRVVSEPGRTALRELRDALGTYATSSDVEALGCSLEDWREEQLAALDCVEELFEVAEAAGIPREVMTDSFVDLLRQSSVPVQEATFERGTGVAPQVLVLSQAAAARPVVLRPATLIACDLDSASYPAAERDDACSRLLYERLGLEPGEDCLTRMRREWNELVSLPTRGFVAMRCLNDFDGNPTYPCAMLEEFVDTYRDLASEDALTGDDLDRTYLLPETLLDRVTSMGEDGLFQDALAGIAEPDLVEVDDDGMASRAWIALRDENGQIALSPTAVDAYRACPYNWFIGRRLETAAIDERLDAPSLGTFYHAVFRAFSIALRDAGMSRVLPSNVDAAKELMGRVFDSTVAAQRKADESGRGNVGRRYVPKPGTTEVFELERIRANLERWVEFQAEFLAEGDSGGEGLRFVPEAFELDLKNYGIQFADAHLRGTIDRVDVDVDRGEAIVIDYKGSFTGKGYGLGFDDGEEVLPRERALQGLIYADAIQSAPELRRKLELPEDASRDVVKAVLYSSYDPRFALEGTLVFGDDGKFPPILAGRLGAKAMARRGVAGRSYRRFLDVLESTVRTEVVEPMERGEIPRMKGLSCGFCPVVWCPERKSNGRF